MKYFSTNSNVLKQKCFQKFKTMLFTIFQKTTYNVAYFFETLGFQQKYLIGCENHWNRTFLKSVEHYTIILSKKQEKIFFLKSKLFKLNMISEANLLIFCSSESWKFIFIKFYHVRAGVCTRARQFSLWKKFQKISKKVKIRHWLRNYCYNHHDWWNFRTTGS